MKFGKGAAAGRKEDGESTRQCNWWNTENAERWGARLGCLKKPPCSGKIRDQAVSEALDGAEPNMGAYSKILEEVDTVRRN